METIAKRCSCRAYRPEQITPEELKQLLQAANAAPVGMAKYETLKISVVQSRELFGGDRSGRREILRRSFHASSVRSADADRHFRLCSGQ